LENQHIDRAIESMIQIPPIIHRKLHRELFKVVLQQFGMDMAPHHLMILKELRESGSLHSSQIGDAISIARPQMTLSIDKLIELGMVEREPDTIDRRKISIKLTKKGRKTMEQVDKVMKDFVRDKLSVLSDDELDNLSKSFECIAQTFIKLQ